MTTTKTLYLDRDNPATYTLEDTASETPLTAVTAIWATFGSVTIKSTDKLAGDILWEDDGDITIDIGTNDVLAGLYAVRITTFSPTYSEGYVWGKVNIRVEDIPDSEE